MGGRSRELSCRVRSERHLQEALQPGGEEAARSSVSTRAAGEAADPAAQPELGSARCCFSRQLVLISMVTSQHCQAAGLLSGAGGLGWRTAVSFSPVPTLLCWPRELPGKAGRSMGFWPLTQRLLLSPASVWGLGAQLPVLERMLPAPLPLPEACHSKAWVQAKGQLQASQKPHPCLAHAHLLGVQPQAEGGRGRGRGVLAQGWFF